MELCGWITIALTVGLSSAFHVLICQASAIAVAVALHPPVATCTQGSARTLWAWPPTRVVSRALGLSGTLCGSELTLGCLAHSGFVSHTLGLP